MPGSASTSGPAVRPPGQHGEGMSNPLAFRMQGAKHRLLGVDLARALALVGMVATHTMELSDEVGNAYPVAILAGKAAALFAVLAGFSITLATRKYETATESTVALLVRGALIAVIGLVLGSISTHIAVILVNYGVMFMLAPLVLSLSTRTLTLLAPTWLVVTPLLGFGMRSLTDVQRMTAVPNLGNYTDLHYLTNALFLSGYYPILQWFGYLLVGLLLSRLDWSAAGTWWKTALAGAASAASAYAVSTLLLTARGMDVIRASAGTTPPTEWGSVEMATRLGSYGTVPTDTWWWLAVAGPHTGTPFDMLYTAGLAAAVIACCIAVCQRLGRPFWMLPLLAAGSMPLTLYSAHVVLREYLDPFVAHVGILLMVATIWRLYTSRPGPLEWGVSKLVSFAVPGARRGSSPRRVRQSNRPGSTAPAALPTDRHGETNRDRSERTA